MMTKRSLLLGAVAAAAAPTVGAASCLSETRGGVPFCVGAEFDAGLRRRKMVITGHLGNIGSRVLPHYAQAWDVVGIDKKDGAEFDLSIERVNFGWADRLAGADTVLHLAASALPTGSADEIYQNNILATAHLLEAAVRVGVKRIVFASSSHAAPGLYGHPVGWYSPYNPYGASKLFGEALLSNAARDGLVAASIVRVKWAPAVGTDTSGAPAWLQKLLWHDVDLLRAFDEAVDAECRYIQVE